MTITYEKIKSEVRIISEEMVNSSNKVPSIFSTVKYGLLPAGVYFTFFLACPFADVFIKNIWMFLGFLSFFFWVFISIFISGYSQFFSLLPEGAQERFEIVRICCKKMKVYYAIWLASVFVAGLLALFTIWNVIALAVVTVLSTVLIALAFNFDMSRYQLASLFGVISAIKEKPIK
ncbi:MULTISPECIES: hypothetical protein [Pantoea]|jgi:hypothetical protein|uniref:Conjugal transfer entry exclusion protein TraS n=1 Tax=Pantoea brenneri TaxID=472694 RepID=A0A653YPF1_9GAMM|nr:MULTISPECIES: hypothetical protein [Pantoea]MBZ6396884.1 hypothetical protein [Pantoea sp.]MBZ6440104.1 hypothetical protein [Pantoea sp.]MDH1088408.1 hypothetical protein [Pantoea brenneri]MDU4129911.1 hypothetical protein [Pantoea sp.]MDU7865693.1 hypothetical protein [Pantoea sp.]